MPSARYTLNIDPEDLKPDLPPELTPKQKRQNWWLYNKQWVALALVVVCIVGLGIKDMVQRVEPDYKVLYISPTYLAESISEQLRDNIAALGQDLNGDGEVVVDIIACQINFYDEFAEVDASDPDAQDSTANDAYVQMAGVTRLMAEVDACDSLIIITDEPEDVKESYQIVEDGTLYKWLDCPTLVDMNLTYTDFDGQEYAADVLFRDMCIACRSYDPEKPMKAYEAENRALFQALVQGATPYTDAA